MSDADDSYDFSEIPNFVKKLREGYELVRGCRLPAGGGSISAGAMPFSHRYQSVIFTIFTKTFAISEGLLPEDARMNRFFEIINLERGLLVSFMAVLIGIVLLLLAVNQWRLAEFGPLDYAQTMRLVIPGATLTALGFQTFFSSFFVSIPGKRRR